MADIFNMLDTWNASGTTFTGIKLSVTDTASAAGSLLMDLQVGGSSRFSVAKGGAITAQGATTNDIAVFGFRTSTSIAEIYLASNSGGGKFYATANEGSNLGRVVLASTGQYTFSPNANLNSGTTVDLILARDAANTLAQRNGVNAQAFNLYNTYTDASNYERGMMRWNTNVLEIGTQSAGTGTLRTIALRGDIIALGKASQGAYDISLVPAGSNTLNISQPGGGAPLQQISSSGIKQRATYQFAWSAGNDASASADTGIARSAAGVAKITNGSTGTGQLIFIVPTTDPGITGALWNNAGTLSISA